MQEILAVYQACEVSFAWQQGDIVLVDNVLTAHARNPFSGERKLLVAMGSMRSYAWIRGPQQAHIMGGGIVMSDVLLQGFQLSPQQKHLWLMHNSNSSSTHYMSQTCRADRRFSARRNSDTGSSCSH